MILDEIKKKRLTDIEIFLNKIQIDEPVVKLSDIENILGEKCNWKHFKEYRRTSCEGKDGKYTILNQFGIDVWKHCPYCGKEIQEVKDEN